MTTQVIADALVTTIDQPRRAELTDRLERGSFIHATTRRTAVGNHHAGDALEIRCQGFGDPPADPSISPAPPLVLTNGSTATG